MSTVWDDTYEQVLLTKYRRWPKHLQSFFRGIFINKHIFIEEFIFSSSLDDDDGGEHEHVSDFSEDDYDDEDDDIYE